jgi:hypothetical protein
MARAQREQAADNTSPSSQGGEGGQGNEKKPSAAEFILAQPRDMSPPDVAAAGKAAGYEFTPNWVYKVRRASGTKAAAPKRGTVKKAAATKAAKPKAKAPAAKATSAKATTRGAAKPAAKAAKAPAGKAATPAYTGSKTSFVLGCPPDMSLADVVAAAKAQGIEISPNYVSNIRATAKMKRKAAKQGKAAPVSAPASKPAKEVAASGLSKTEFVLSFPPETSAADIIAAGKRQGIKLSTSHVYHTKATSKTKGTAAPKAAAAPAAPKAAPRAAAAAPRSSDDDAAFFELVVRVGLTRAEAMLSDVSAKLKGMVRGG